MNSNPLIGLGLASLTLALTPWSPSPAASAQAPTRTAPAASVMAPAAPVVMAPAAPVVILYNHTTGRCLDLPGAGKGKRFGPVEQWLCRPETDDNQRFEMRAAGKHGPYQRFMLRNQKDGYCLDLPTAGAVPSGTRLREGRCVPSDNQMWYRVPVRGGAWLLVNEKSKLCLDVVGAKPATLRAPLAVATCSMTDDHVWRMVPPSQVVGDDVPAPKPAKPAPAAKTAKPAKT
ncbi:MAG: ricin-type beta-trefoil lectin domain protein [Austwickia sp.]|nr:ricin-type beta-trefoil lectin domain protein [Austwickia sp.]